MYQMTSNLAKIIREADAIIILCGAGMGVDSGLSTFRGANAKGWTHSVTGREVDYYDICQGYIFDEHDHADREEAVKFWKDCRNQYQKAVPHEGYEIIMKWVKDLPYFVFTTNVDHHWSRVGVPENRLLEIHGSIDKLQCSKPRNNACLSLQDWTVNSCPSCGGKMRPNILMFNDRGYIDEHQYQIKKEYEKFIKDNCSKNVVLLTIGAGDAVPTISTEVNSLMRKISKITQIVINPDKFSSTYVISKGALDGLRELDKEIVKLKTD